MVYRRVAMIKHKILRKLIGTAFLLLPLIVLGLTAASCSKEETEASEWDNWQQRNVEYTNYIVNCYQTNAKPELAPQGLGWKRLKAYSKDAATEGSINEYIYAYVIEEGNGSVSPAYTDSVRVIYQGRLIPTSTYTEGYVFDGTVNSTFSMTVIESNSALPWNSMPTSRCNKRISLLRISARSRPSYKICPSSIACRPIRLFINTVLPEPD